MKLSALAAGLVCLSVGANAQPFHDSIPTEFQGIFAPNLVACADQDGIEIINIDQNGIHYYEGDDYLIIGVKFEGSSTKSGSFVPLFNGRFTGRMETQLLGDVNARIEMETTNNIIRYALKDDGEPDPKPINNWVRCPKKP